MKPMAVGLSSSYENRCESTEEGQFKVCAKNVNFENLPTSSPSGKSGGALCIDSQGNFYIDSSGICS